ncbi:hypothetical protein [Bremerella cremea]|uniref:hypothetical protein n=1 Tax=Bremerella cremea TaxID=1031537 RepID=UPI0031F05B4D
MKSTQLGLMLLAAIGLSAQTAAAQEWGTVTGRFIVDGKVATLPADEVTKDAGFCGAKLPNQTLTVSEDGGLKNVAVWLYLDRGQDAPAVHPSYAEATKKPVVIDNKACLYEPHISAVVVGQPVEFKNSDPIPHNFKVEGFANAGMNNLVPVGGVFEHKFDSEERYPMNASCSIHPWMTAKIVVRELPYMAVSAEDGTFTIENLPVGKHKLQVWHEIPGTVKEMQVGGKKVKDRKGLLEIEVKAGQNDLGNLVIDAGDLK